MNNGLYWARSKKVREYTLVLVTENSMVQGILDECPRSIAQSAWSDYKPAIILDPLGNSWIPSL